MSDVPIAVVTGGGAGLGVKLAEEFKDWGWDVVTVGHGCDIETDLRRYDGWMELIASRLRRAPDALINNAGITRIQYLQDYTDADWDDVLAVNLSTPFRAIRAFAGLVRGSGREHTVVNITSMAHKTPLRCSPAYCASKAGLNHLTTTLAKELIDTCPNMRLYNVAPNGMSETNMIEQAERALVDVRGMTPAAAHAYIRNNPYKSLQDPREVANQVVWLCDERPKWANGSTYSYPAAML